MSTLSRNAELIALTFFAMGKPCSFKCGPAKRLTPDARAAFDELVEHGMIRPISAENLGIGMIGWRATDKIGFPLRDFARPTVLDTLEIFI